MRSPTVLLVALALCVGARAASFPLLETLEPAYEYANVTVADLLAAGLDETSAIVLSDDLQALDCWLFSTTSLNLLQGGNAYLIQYNTADASAVANAWCTLQGFEKATDFAQAEIPVTADKPFYINTIDVATGKTSQNAIGSTTTGFKYIECASGANANAAGCSAALPQRSGSGNRGYMNDGSNNFGNFNTGSNNFGDWNTGSSNYGSFNIGSGNKGSFNRASNCVGNSCTVPNQITGTSPLV